MTRLPVAILGATGTVGQQFIRLLAEHPWFEIAQLVASADRVGKRYGDEVRWRESTPLPDAVADIRMSAPTPQPGIRLAFSALDAAVARDLEPALAQAGVLVVSNASAFRMDPDVPLLLPEINPDHLVLLERQRQARGWSGGIIANPNCCVAALATALAPLDRAFGLRSAVVATLQAASGAGYPGVPSLDILGNVIPWIGGSEEEKIAAETRKILGQVTADGIADHPGAVSAMVHRVPVIDGHLLSIAAAFTTRPTPDEATAVLSGYRPDALAASLPSTPAASLEVDARTDRPQPRLDLWRGNGMTVSVGRVRPCEVQDLRLVALGHNLVRGAAGAAVQNAELAVAAGLVS